MDSAKRRELIEQFARGYDDLVETVMDIPKEAWDFKAAPDRWSITEIVIHIGDSEANAYVRCRAALAEPGKAIMAYDQTGWATRLGYEKRNPDDYLELFKWLRLTTHDLIRNLPEAAWENSFDHPEHGTQTLDDWLHTYAIHVSNHIKQISRAYEDWKRK